MNLFFFRHNRFCHTDRIPNTKITFYEVTFVMSGSLTYQIDRKNITMKSGDVIFVRENSSRSREAAENTDYFSFNFHKDPDDDPLDLPLYIDGGIGNEIKLLLSACNEIHNQMVDDTDRLTLILQCILKQLVVNLDIRGFNPLTLKIKRYITTHIHERISLDDIGKAMFFSPTYCSAVFRRETGKSIINYILDEKVNEAKKLILEGVPLTQVAEQVGFDDYNYFSRTFTKRTSYSPKQYKNNTSPKI